MFCVSGKTIDIVNQKGKQICKLDNRSTVESCVEISLFGWVWVFLKSCFSLGAFQLMFNVFYFVLMPIWKHLYHYYGKI